MKLYSALAYALSLLGLQQYVGMVELEHKPYYNYNETHYPAYENERWGSVSVQKLKNANIFEQKKLHGNAVTYEMGTQFYRLNDAEKLGAVKALKNVLDANLDRHESVFLVDCISGAQIGMYSDQFGIILH